MREAILKKRTFPRLGAPRIATLSTNLVRDLPTNFSGMQEAVLKPDQLGRSYHPRTIPIMGLCLWILTQIYVLNNHRITDAFIAE